ncbi:MAG: sugar transferase [Bacteroidetes bacterium]|nr:sugar transferase [Bacteroidota bacterium]
MKRLFDFIFSLLVLLILLPIFIPISIIQKFTGEGYIFYLQERMGQNMKIFKIWKFATMLKDSPNLKGGEITLRNDPRITPLGKYLRITKINELPQIINILKGDMSIVGPRPLMIVSFNQYSPEIQKIVSQMKPGLTGIGSLIFRDEEKLVTNAGMNPKQYYKLHIFPYKGSLEKWYSTHISFSTDIILIFLTAWQIFFPESNLVYRIFKDLPIRPKELKIR